MNVIRGSLLTMIGVAVVVSVSGAVEVTIGPAPPWYRPMLLELKESPPETLSAQPEYIGQPLFGAVYLGDAEDNVFTVVIDLGTDWTDFKRTYAKAEGKVEMPTVPARIYVDTNNDEDLTNDGNGVVGRCIESRRTPGSFTIVSAEQLCHVTYADGQGLEYPVTIYMFPQRGKVKLRDGSERDYSRTAFYYRNGSFETKLTIAGRQVLARFYDENSDAIIMSDDRDRLAIDLNEDGEIEPNLKGPEIYDLAEPFHFNGESYVLKTYGPRGNDATVTVSDTKVEPPIYIAPGEAAPDFTATTLDGKTFKLSEQRGRVILLDFWATWCPPCLEAIPHLVEMWKNLKQKGLVLVGVSLDRNDEKSKATEKVAQFATEHEMTWTHIVEGKYWSSDIADLYQVSGIPQTILIGPNGKIIAVGLRGKKLHEAAEKALKAAQ